MSTSEPFDTVSESWPEDEAAPESAAHQASAPIVPSDSIAGRSLTAVVAIMTFLATLATGGAMLVVDAASDWQSDVAREVTIQVRPVSGRDLEADVTTATAIARDTTGVSDVRAYSRQESAELVEPWLGSGLALGGLPIPRIIVVTSTIIAAGSIACAPWRRPRSPPAWSSSRSLSP